MNLDIQPAQDNNPNEHFYHQKFLEHAAFSEHYARQKMATAANATNYYMYAELEYYHKSRAIHYKGLFSAESTLTNYNLEDIQY